MPHPVSVVVPHLRSRAAWFREKCLSSVLKKPYALLWKVTDHLVGIRRPDFRRLFLATSSGRQCPELDRFGVTVAPCTQEVTARETGYWLPEYTWPLVKIMFKQAHLEAVKEGKESPLSTRSQPEKGSSEAWAVAKPLESEGS